MSFLGKNRERYIDTHGCDSLSAVLRHCKDRSLYILIGITKRFLETGAFLFRILRNIFVRDRKILQLNQIAVQPLSVRFLVRVFLFQFLIVNNSSRNRVNKKHLTRMQAFLHKDLGRINVQHSYF